jgi:subtilisin family serine protease
LTPEAERGGQKRVEDSKWNEAIAAASAFKECFEWRLESQRFVSRTAMVDRGLLRRTWVVAVPRLSQSLCFWLDTVKLIVFTKVNQAKGGDDMMKARIGSGQGIIATAALFSTMVVLSLFPLEAQASISRIRQAPEHVPGELVVTLRKSPHSGDSLNSTLSTQVFSRLLHRLGANAVLSIESFQTDKSAYLVKLSQDQDMRAAIAQLKSEKGVETAEPNAIYHAFDDGIPNDPDFVKTWALNNTGQKSPLEQEATTGVPGADIHILPMWKDGIRGSRDILVAVIDTGIDSEHPDLKDNIYTNPGEIAGDGKDNDENGFVDDIHGWNFAAKSNNSVDDNGHGTHCAGTIGGVGNNGVGVAGVNWEVTLLPLKFLSASGSGTLKDAVEAINYARMMKVKVMSNSWGGGAFSETLLKAIEDARDAGILFVAAAGNDSANNDANPTYPASYDVLNVIAVAATDNRDMLAKFSNFGSRSVHVAAPGAGIYSTYKNGTYKTLSGTSMAAPHVAGLSALLLSTHPEWNFSEIKNRIIKSCDVIPTLGGKVVSMGRINALNALQGIESPGKPDDSAWITTGEVIESDHPYKDRENVVFKVSRPGARWMRVHFEKISTEKTYDKVILEKSQTDVIDEISGEWADLDSTLIPGDQFQIRFRTDYSNTGWGFKIDRIQYIPGN